VYVVSVTWSSTKSFGKMKCFFVIGKFNSYGHYWSLLTTVHLQPWGLYRLKRGYVMHYSLSLKITRLCTVQDIQLRDQWLFFCWVKPTFQDSERTICYSDWSYRNNGIKTMVALRWTLSNSLFYCCYLLSFILLL